ncbi:sulfur carrier protein ThiS [Ochrovirga pacifica]|uniref:sulfur carrier protein ThiS n=1 Tax=Ochrovirga pacifica TaxID=1042376 RepID=UPI000255A2D3|nr:sulfur carrier protein ThiS [Ochrovirga pacifica]
MITIKINNQSKEISENSSVANLLSELNQPENGIAVAINQQIITKTDWETKEISDGDDILIIQATQGG